jgi:hypothetical protein
MAFMLKELTLHILIADAFKTTLLERDVIVEHLPIELQEWAIDTMPTIIYKSHKDYTVENHSKKSLTKHFQEPDRENDLKKVSVLGLRGNIYISFKNAYQSYQILNPKISAFGELSQIRKYTGYDYSFFLHEGTLHAQEGNYSMGMVNGHLEINSNLGIDDYSSLRETGTTSWHK